MKMATRKRALDDSEISITFTKQVSKRNKIFTDGKLRISPDFSFLKVVDMYEQQISSIALRGHPVKFDLFMKQYARAFEDGEGLIQGVLDGVLVHIDGPPPLEGITSECERKSPITPICDPFVCPVRSTIVPTVSAFSPVSDPRHLYGQIGERGVSTSLDQYCLKLVNSLYKEIHGLLSRSSVSLDKNKYIVDLFPDGHWKLQVGKDGKAFLCLPPSTRAPKEYIDVFVVTTTSSSGDCILFSPKWKGFDIRGKIEVEPISIEAQRAIIASNDHNIRSVKGIVGLHCSLSIIPTVKSFLASSEKLNSCCIVGGRLNRTLPDNGYCEDHLVESIAEKFTREQSDILSAVASWFKCGDTSPPIISVQGVFGSGKTAVLAASIYLVSKLAPRARILLIAATNVAVDNVLLRLRSQFGFDNFARVGVEQRIDSEIQPFLVKPASSKAAAKWSKSLVAATATCAMTEIDSEVDFVFVEEASQLTEVSSVPILMRTNAKRVVMFGDDRQLHQPGTEDISPPLLEAFTQGTKRLNMYTQFRCDPRIATICSDLFYDGKVVSVGPQCDREMPAVAHVVHQHASSRGSQSSQVNVGEMELVFKFLRDKIEYVKNRRVSIISFYNAQVDTIRDELKLCSWASPIKAIRVDTVDSFQGGEADVVLLSVTASNASRSENFIAYESRVNVAISRAKQHLVIFAHSQIWERITLYNRIRNHYSNEIQL